MLPWCQTHFLFEILDFISVADSFSVCHANSSAQVCCGSGCVASFSVPWLQKMQIGIAADSCWQYVWYCGQTWQKWNHFRADELPWLQMSPVKWWGTSAPQWCVQCYGQRSGPMITRCWKGLSELLTHRQIKEDAVIICRNKSFSFCFWSSEFLKYKDFFFQCGFLKSISELLCCVFNSCAECS